MSSSTDLVVAYDGEALKDHQIDVRDLAPALLAFGQLFEEANRALNGDDGSEVRVRMKATGIGSFEIHLEVFQELAKQMRAFLTGDGVQAAMTLKDILGLGGSTGLGLIAIIKKLKNRRAKKIANLRKGATLQVDGEELDVPAAVMALLESVPVRTALRKVLDPLNKPGIDKFEVRDPGSSEPLVEIDKSELSYFDVPAVRQSEELQERTWTGYYSIVSLAFKGENKWRLTEGQVTISALIRDEAFLKRVSEGLSFAKNDLLLCDMLSRQVHAADGLRIEYEVIRVVEHRQAPRQFEMFD